MRAPSPSDRATVSSRAARSSRSTTSMDPSVDSTWRATRAPTAPTPITAMLVTSPSQGVVGELLPAASLRRHPTGASDPQHRGDGPGDAKCDERPAQHLHEDLPERGSRTSVRGASWNRTNDLTLIRGAL